MIQLSRTFQSTRWGKLLFSGAANCGGSTLTLYLANDNEISVGTQRY